MKSQMRRARSFLLWLAKEPAWFIVCDRTIVLSDEAQERLAEAFADAQEEVREGFLRKPTKREPKVHD